MNISHNNGESICNYRSVFAILWCGSVGCSSADVEFLLLQGGIKNHLNRAVFMGVQQGKQRFRSNTGEDEETRGDLAFL